MNEAEFYCQLKELNIILTEEQKKQFSLYANFLLQYNQHTNLTAIRNKEGIYLKHFYDSLTLTKAFDTNQKYKILDIGSGAGFPGLVLAICFPNLEIHLLDSNYKKIKFLEETVQLLKLKNVKIIYDRAENFSLKTEKKYDLITSRAVAELRILLEISFPALKINGNFIAMKGFIEEELNQAKDTIALLNGTLKKIIYLELPKQMGTRNIVLIEKTKDTPKNYPRQYATILKKPLKKKS